MPGAQFTVIKYFTQLLHGVKSAGLFGYFDLFVIFFAARKSENRFESGARNLIYSAVLLLRHVVVHTNTLQRNSRHWQQLNYYYYRLKATCLEHAFNMSLTCI